MRAGLGCTVMPAEESPSLAFTSGGEQAILRARPAGPGRTHRPPAFQRIMGGKPGAHRTRAFEPFASPPRLTMCVALPRYVCLAAGQLRAPHGAAAGQTSFKQKAGRSARPGEQSRMAPAYQWRLTGASVTAWLAAERVANSQSKFPRVQVATMRVLVL